MILLIITAILLFKRFKSSAEGKLKIDAWKLQAPVVGKVFRLNMFGQFARTLSTLLINGVPVLTALKITEEIMPNVVIKDAIAKTRAAVTDGKTIAQPLAQSKIFPQLMIDLIKIGEETGDVPGALKNVAETYENELTIALRVMTNLIEPAMIIMMALLVGFLLVQRVVGDVLHHSEYQPLMNVNRQSPMAGCRAFTLIEIMVVVAIMAVLLSLALPSFWREAHKDSMRKAVLDLSEACSQARARAVLNGISTEVRIRPGDRSINVVEGAASRPSSAGGPSYVVEGDELVDRRASGGGAIFSAKLSDHIIIEFIGVNLVPDLHELHEVTALFYPNGTCDELVVLIRSDKGEVRKLTTDVVTGIADVEVIR